VRPVCRAKLRGDRVRDGAQRGSAPSLVVIDEKHRVRLLALWQHAHLAPADKMNKRGLRLPLSLTASTLGDHVREHLFRRLR
jgi:hypothetical protein